MNNTAQQLKQFARDKYAWPGGYPMFAITSDGGALSHSAVIENYRLIRESMRDGSGSGWNVVAVAINWEDSDLYCDHTGERIESACSDE